MKNLEKIFMVIGFLTSVISMVIAMYDGESWLWQLTTSIWICVVFIKQNLIEKLEKLVEKTQNL